MSISPCDARCERVIARYVCFRIPVSCPRACCYLWLRRLLARDFTICTSHILRFLFSSAARLLSSRCRFGADLNACLLPPNDTVHLVAFIFTSAEQRCAVILRFLTPPRRALPPWLLYLPRLPGVLPPTPGTFDFTSLLFVDTTHVLAVVLTGFLAFFTPVYRLRVPVPISFCHIAVCADLVSTPAVCDAPAERADVGAVDRFPLYLLPLERYPPSLLIPVLSYGRLRNVLYRTLCRLQTVTASYSPLRCRAEPPPPLPSLVGRFRSGCAHFRLYGLTRLLLLPDRATGLSPTVFITDVCVTG